MPANLELPTSPFSSPMEIIPLFDYMNLIILDITYKWNHTVFVFL